MNAVCYSPDGNRLATASADKTVKLWDARIGEDLLSLEGHKEAVRAVHYRPDGRRLASASEDGTVKVWDVESGEEVLSLPGHTGAVDAVRYSPDGRRLASAGSDRLVKLWDAEAGTEVFTFRGHAGDVVAVSFSPDGSRLASASWDGTVKVWDTSSGGEVVTLKGHDKMVAGVAYLPDGSRLASAAWDGTVKLWDAYRGDELLTLPVGAAEVFAVTFSPDAGRLAAACSDGTVRRWDGRYENEVTHFPWINRRLNPHFGPDSNLVLQFGGEAPDGCWSLPETRPVGHVVSKNAPTGKNVSPDGRFGLSVEDNQVRVLANQSWAIHVDPWAEIESRRPVQVPLWHAEQARLAEQQQDWYAAAFHVSQLAQHRPWDASLHRRAAELWTRAAQGHRAAVHYAWGAWHEAR
jgi:WD40 repeat protein